MLFSPDDGKGPMQVVSGPYGRERVHFEAPAADKIENEGFMGKLTTSKWAKIAKCSQDTALRDIQDLIEHSVLVKEPSGGRSTSYLLRD